MHEQVSRHPPPPGRTLDQVGCLFLADRRGVIGPLAGKLTSAEKNDARRGCPPAPSRPRCRHTVAVQSPDMYAAVVVYDRSSGLTGADKAKAAADAQVRRRARRGAQPAGRSDTVGGRQGHGDYRAGQPRLQGWDGASAAATKRPPSPAPTRAAGLPDRRPGGHGADSIKVFKGGGGACCTPPAVVIGILLMTYRSPVRRLLPVIPWRRASVRAGADYLSRGTG